MFRNFRNHKIEAYATINAVKKPTARIPKSLVCKYGITLIKSNVHARNIRGTAIIKVKSAAAFLDMPSSRLPAIVLPLLENPGQRERHWKNPIFSACLDVIRSTSVTVNFFLFFSAKIIKTPPSTRPMITV